MTPPTIRPARPADHARLRAIQQSALAEPEPDILATAVDGLLLALVRINDADRIVGYVSAVVTDRRAYVPELAVTPAEQDRGHGSALLDALCDRLRAQGIETVRLTARADDDVVRSFYESRGFQAVERVSDHYESGADGVVYEREL